MIDLIAQIQMAQRDAGERAVIAHLDATMAQPRHDETAGEKVARGRKESALRPLKLAADVRPPVMTEDRIRAIVRSELISLGLITVRDVMD